ncbi:MAG: hypothetical protein V4596_05295 [Bdellovibrionota bacterium]
MKQTTTEMKSDFKSKANSAGKNAKSTVENALETAPEVLATVTEFGKNVLDSMSGSKEKILQTVTTSYNSLNKTIKEKPWTFVGGAAVVGFVAGFLLGRNRSPESSIRSGIMSGVDKIKSEIEKNIDKVSERLQ